MLDDIDIDSDDSSDGGSWFSRARGGSRRLSSAALFLGALALLFWNETYSKRHADALSEAAAQVQEASVAAIDPQLDGKPVHLSANVISTAGAKDDVFNVRTDGVALYRQVQMFQWIEYEETSGRGAKKRTTYSYAQDWDSEYHDSSQFNQPSGHENPKPTIESASFYAADARFGPYKFDNDSVAEQALNEYGDTETPGSLGDWASYVEQLPAPSATLTNKRWYQLDAGTYYRGDQASDQPALGDLQVSFYSLSNDYPLTMLAAQQGEHLESWRASNGDSILLAAGGKLPADRLVKIAEAQGAGLTHILRIAGLAGAVIGAAGVAAWLGGFLSMIPVVGRVVSVSLSIAGGLFGLMAGLLTIVVGWLVARPWVAAVLLIAIGTAVTWAIRKGRSAQDQARRTRRAADLASAARLRAAEALGQAGNGGMALAGAGPGGAVPPPPPGADGKAAPVARAAGSSTPTKRVAPIAPPPPPVAEDPKELPPLEWTPGLLVTTPPAVRPRSGDTAAAPARPPERERPTPPATTPTRLPAAATAVKPVAPVAAAADAADSRPALPMFDTVPMREPTPLFEPIPSLDLDTSIGDSTPLPAPAPPARPPMNAPTPVSARTPPAAVPVAASAPALFDTVPLREQHTPLAFDSMPQLPAKPAPADDDFLNIQLAPTPAPPKTVRIALGSKGDYALHKIVREHADGKQEVLCFELSQAGKPIKRGSQDEVKEALRQALASKQP